MKKSTKFLTTLSVICAFTFQGISAQTDGNGLKATFYSLSDATKAAISEGGTYGSKGAVIGEDIDLFDGTEVGTEQFPTGDFFIKTEFTEEANNGLVGDNNYWSAKFVGKIKGPIDGEVTFTMNGDNGYKLTIGETVVIDFWKNDWEIETTGTFTMVKDQMYDIKLEYFEAWGGQNLLMQWSGEGLEIDFVPKIALYSEDATTDATLSSLKLGGVSVPNFSKDVTDYTVNLTDTTNWAVKSAITYTLSNSEGQASVLKFGSTLPSTATVTVTAPDGTTTLVYKITVNYNSTAVNYSAIESLIPYPNPTSSFLNIKNVKDTQITILDIDGRVINSFVNVSSNATIDVRNFSKGVYMLKAGNRISKFIVR